MNKDKLLLDVKNRLQVTWDDDDTNSRISSMVEDAIVILNHKLGSTEIDYSQDGIEHSLFLNYCMYSWNNCINEFDRNYINEIYQIRAIYEVKYYEENQI